VDDSLEELGIPKTYQKIHIYMKLVIIGWIVYSLVINFYDTMIFWTQFEETKSWGLLLAHILNHCIYINAFMALLLVWFNISFWFIVIFIKLYGVNYICESVMVR